MARVAIATLAVLGSCAAHVDTVSAPAPASAPPLRLVKTWEPATRVPIWRPPPPLGGAWQRLRVCESGDNYRQWAGEPGGGAYQFDPRTWRSFATVWAHAADAPWWVQDWEAVHLLWRAGVGQWPVCGPRAGL